MARNRRQGESEAPRLRDRVQAALLGAWILVFLAIGLFVILDMRRTALHEAETVSRNILDVTARSIERDIELYDLSIQAVVANVGRADIQAMPPDLRRMAIFDHSASAKGLGRMHYTDARGNIVDTSFGDPNGVNVADRDYFVAHRDTPNLGLYIGKPVTGRIGKERYLVLSRRLNNPDGTFAGVIVGQIKLDYLRQFFRTIRQAEGGQIGLFCRSGTVYVREPTSTQDRVDDNATIAGTPLHALFESRKDGVGETPEGPDAPARMHSFAGIAGTKLVLDVGVSLDTVLSPWRERAWWMVGILAGLTGTLLHFAFLNHRELTRRRSAERDAVAAKSEALRLSETDSLTGLANRRMFDRTLASALRQSREPGAPPLCLAILDVDHFKRLNDTFGHAAGDEVLKALGKRLAGMAQRAGELACRVGGEEFAVVLPGAAIGSAARWAEFARRELSALTFADPLGGVRVTVSVGVAQAMAGESADHLMERADAALYEAKGSGRDAVRIAGPAECRAAA